MKKLALWFTGLLMAANLSAAEIKIAVIDMDKTFREYYKTKEAEATINERRAAFEKDLRDQMADYQKMVDEITKLKQSSEDKTLAEGVRQEKMKAYETKVQDIRTLEAKINQFKAQRGRQLDDQFVRMRKGIIDEITKLIQDFGAKEKYTLVMDRSGMSMYGVPVLLYSQDVKDVTDEIIKGLNASKPAGSAAAAPAAPAPAKK